MKRKFSRLILFICVLCPIAFGGCGGGGGGESENGTTFSLSAIAVGPSQVDLSWSPAPGIASGYWVYRDGTPIHDYVLYGTSIIDTNASPNTRHCYLVIAVAFLVGETGRSNTSCVQTAGLASGWRISTLVGQGRLGGSPAIAIDSLDNIHIAYIDAGIKYITNKSGTWVVESVEGNVDVYERNYSMALDSSDNVHIVYYDSTNFVFKYATNASGTWTYTHIDNDTGSNCSIAIDSSDNVHVSSIRWPADYYYSTNASGFWTTTFIGGFSGANPGPTSIAVDSANTPHIGFTIQDAQSGYLYYATYSSGSWTSSAIDSAVGNSAGAITVDASDRIYISFSKNQPFQLALAYYDLNNWSTSSIDSQDWVGGDTSIARDNVDRLFISYCDYNDLKYATNESGSWAISFIDTVGDVGLYNSIALDSSGKAHIVYYDATNKVIKLASKL